MTLLVDTPFYLYPIKQTIHTKWGNITGKALERNKIKQGHTFPTHRIGKDVLLIYIKPYEYSCYPEQYAVMNKIKEFFFFIAYVQLDISIQVCQKFQFTLNAHNKNRDSTLSVQLTIQSQEHNPAVWC